MSLTALIVKRGAIRTAAVAAIEEKDAARLGVKVLARLSHGMLVSGKRNQFASLEKEGYRVVIYEGTELLRIGDWTINIKTEPPSLPRSLKVPANLRTKWPHHLVQLAGPPTPEWTRAIEDYGVEVVRRISLYTLFVIGEPVKIERLRDLSFVTWAGPVEPAYRIDSKLLKMRGKIHNVRVGVYPSGEIESVREALNSCQGDIVNVQEANPEYHGQPTYFLVTLRRDAVPDIARLPSVVRIEYAPPDQPTGERETQILVESPTPGYQNSLNNLGVDGTNVTIAICDTGVDAGPNNNASGHLDLRGRQAAFIDYSGALAWNSDNDGHGTHVAGIAIGNAATGQTEAAPPNNFLWGQGTAPASRFITQQRGQPLQLPAGSYPQFTREAVTNGADVQNNSWGASLAGYDARAETYDQLVRHPNQNATTLDNLCIVIAAGNDGGFQSTLGSPAEAKNVITVGNSLTFRPGVGVFSDNIRAINGCSSRGPGQSANKTRIKPDVVAPGTDVSSIWSETGNVAKYGAPIPGTGTLDPANPGNMINQYMFMSGTSMSAPHVSGCCALLVEWWRNRTNGHKPSPAMLKALLINGAEDLGLPPAGENWKEVPNNRFAATAGVAHVYQCNNLDFTPQQVFDNDWNVTPPQRVMTHVGSLAAINANGQWFYDAANDILYVRRFNGAAPTFRSIWGLDAAPLGTVPNFDQGWGLVSLPNIMLKAPPPGSPPQIPGTDRGPKIFSDQRHAFTANNDTVVFRVAPVDTNRPMRITLVWTDGPSTAGNAALINDLDLEVREIATNNLYRGNVFANGFSTTGGNADNENNVECVFIQNPNGIYEVTVIASNLTGNARPPFDNTPWQDFALVIDNAEYANANPVCIVPVVDRSGSMTTSGYVDITKTSSNQFIDMMSPDDEIGLVSFGNSGDIEYPTDGSNMPKKVTDNTVLEAAKTEVDQIDFSHNECTYMGEGIIKARDLLNQSPSNLEKAMVLLSDGYDNRGANPAGGCDWNNLAKPSALDIAGALVDIPVYTCAMGQQSDQNLLNDIATITNGRYYYMPTIDDLFEIYNYIRGQVSGEGIIVNDTSTASKSRLSGWVDCGATRATFTAAWNDSAFHYVDHEPKSNDEISVRLRDPNGRLLHPNCTYVRCKVGHSYVVFSIDEPIPGRWYVEVETRGKRHVRYTVGGFVNSPIRMVLTPPKRIILEEPFEADVMVFDGQSPVTTLKAIAQVKVPKYDVPTLLRLYRKQLERINLDDQQVKECVSKQSVKLAMLHNQMVAQGKADIFAHTVETVYGRVSGFTQTRVDHRTIQGTPTVARPIALHTGMAKTRVEEFEQYNVLSKKLLNLSSAVASLSKEIDAFKGAISQAYSVKIPVVARKTGSMNIAVTATGISPMTDCHFERKDLLSMIIK